MRRTWDRERTKQVLEEIRADVSIPRMTRMAGAHRSTIYRWIKGEVQPDYEPVYRLAYAIWEQYPGLAQELVEASGYAWAEPDQAPEPLVPPEVTAVIRKNYSPEQQGKVLALLESMASERRAWEQSEDDAASPRVGG